MIRWYYCYLVRRRFESVHVHKLLLIMKEQEKNQEFAELRKQLAYWMEYKPINNMSKWARKARIESITEKIMIIKNSKK